MINRVSKAQYQELIEDDIEVIMEWIPECMERDHMIMILEHSVSALYPEKPTGES